MGGAWGKLISPFLNLLSRYLQYLVAYLYSLQLIVSVICDMVHKFLFENRKYSYQKNPSMFRGSCIWCSQCGKLRGSLCGYVSIFMLYLHVFTFPVLNRNICTRHDEEVYTQR